MGKSVMVRVRVRVSVAVGPRGSGTLAILLPRVPLDLDQAP